MTKWRIYCEDCEGWPEVDTLCIGKSGKVTAQTKCSCGAIVKRLLNIE